MKTNSSLLLASLALLALNASAAQSEPEPNVVVLPAYVVSAPRYQASELKVIASLDELRHQAQAPTCIVVKLPMAKDQAMTQCVLVKATQNTKMTHVAKL